MNGKVKCYTLKQIRRDIANANDITLEIPDCTHKGDCPGTCPRCESEVRYLERALAERRRRGLKIAVAGISAGLIAVSSVSCDVIDKIANIINGDTLQGDMLPTEFESTEGLMAAADDTSDESEITDTELQQIAIAGFIQADPEAFDETVSTDTYVLEGDIAFIDDAYDTSEETQ